MFEQKKGVAEKLLQNGILFQVNSDFLTEWKTRSKASRMMKRGEIHFIGSDCHNLSDRSPNAEKGYAQIEKKLGSQLADAFKAYGMSMVSKVRK